MNRVKEIERINTVEVESGISASASWHAQYKDSAYIVAAGLDYRLSEGDLLCVFSQCGEIVDLNLVRDKATGKSRGFVFLAYEDQRSTVLAVDNFNGAIILGRTIRVDHVAKYRRPKTSTEAGAEGVNETDDDYDARRKLIWDYEAYAQRPRIDRPPAVKSTGDIDMSAEARQAQRIEKVRQKRKQREQATDSEPDAFGDQQAKRIQEIRQRRLRQREEREREQKDQDADKKQERRPSDRRDRSRSRSRRRSRERRRRSRSRSQSRRRR